MNSPGRGYTARLAKGGGYFCFQFGEAADWLDRSVSVPTVNALSMEEWLTEFVRLRKLNVRVLKPEKAIKKPVRHKV
jgi:hypothetical protein